MPLTDTAARQAKAEGLLEVNPAADLDIVAVPEPPEQHNPYLRRHKLKELLVALRDFKCAEYARSAVKLLLLTGVRTIKLRSATFDRFDFVEGLWTIPPGIVKQLQRRVRTKSGGDCTVLGTAFAAGDGRGEARSPDHRALSLAYRGPKRTAQAYKRWHGE